VPAIPGTPSGFHGNLIRRIRFTGRAATAARNHRKVTLLLL
jgi:hypothetical protein